MSTSSGNSVPSVFNTFRHPTDTYFPIYYKKTPQYAKPTPASVNFPSGHASFPAVSPQALIFSNAIQSFTKSLAEVLEQPTQEEATEPLTSSPQVTPETAKALKPALELLQAQLQEGIRLLPESKQPLPKSLLQVLVQTPVFIEQLRELLQKTSIKQPILEEAEVLVRLPQGTSKEELKLLEELQRKIPAFIKTLQTALAGLPTALPPVIKEALEKYLLSPALQKTVEPLQEEAKPVLEETLPQKVPGIQKSVEEPVRSLIEQPKASLIPKPEVPIQETLGFPRTVIVKPPSQQEAPPLPLEQVAAKIKAKPLQESLLPLELIVKKGEHAPLVKVPLELEAAQKPPSLTKLPELALKEAIEGFYPLMKTLLELLQKEKFIPKEFVALLRQLPVLVEQLKQLFMKEPTLLSHEEKEVLKALQRSIPILLGNLKIELLNLPKFIFPEIRGKLEAYVNNFPLEELANILKKQIKPHPKVAHPIALETPVTVSEKPIEREKIQIVNPLVEEPVTVPEENEGVILEEMAMSEVAEVLEEKSEKTEEDVLSLLSEQEGVEKKGEGHKIESPRTLPLLTVEQFKENIKMVSQPPEFSTDIPFAFIVPYVPNTPIHTPPFEVKAMPHDPMKEELKEDNGDRKKKSVQMFSYIPEGEAWVGDPTAKDDLKKFSLKSYAIGVYLVTNQQFADFLSEQSKLKKIYIGEEGQVFSKDKELLLCQIKSGIAASDIEPEPQENYLAFRSAQEKDDYPVVCVTYYGAKAFCEAGGFRLPTEGEWEKAASLEMTEENTVKKKFTFGCSQDEISMVFANYDTRASSVDVSTTPVGFYNGKTSFMKEGVQVQTADAKSPFGCYDMSGNVWEWVEGDEGGYAVTKGGCFQSRLEDLKVIAKREKSIKSLDRYTGFRVALS